MDSETRRVKSRRSSLGSAPLAIGAILEKAILTDTEAGSPLSSSSKIEQTNSSNIRRAMMIPVSICRSKSTGRGCCVCGQRGIPGGARAIHRLRCSRPYTCSPPLCFNATILSPGAVCKARSSTPVRSHSKILQEDDMTDRPISGIMRRYYRGWTFNFNLKLYPETVMCHITYCTLMPAIPVVQPHSKKVKRKRVAKTLRPVEEGGQTPVTLQPLLEPPGKDDESAPVVRSRKYRI